MIYDEPNRSIFNIRLSFYFDIYSKISYIFTNQETVFFMSYFYYKLARSACLTKDLYYVCHERTLSWPFFRQKKNRYPCTRGSESENLENSYIKEVKSLAGIELSAL